MRCISQVVPAKTSSLGAKKKSGGSGGAAASRSSGSKFADAIADVTFADMSLEEASGVLIDSGICDGTHCVHPCRNVFRTHPCMLYARQCLREYNLA